jgi:hypothetical protein
MAGGVVAFCAFCALWAVCVLVVAEPDVLVPGVLDVGVLALGVLVVGVLVLGVLALVSELVLVGGEELRLVPEFALAAVPADGGRVLIGMPA